MCFRRPLHCGWTMWPIDMNTASNIILHQPTRKAWLYTNVSYHLFPYLWPLSSTDCNCNLLDYYLVEAEANNEPQKNYGGNDQYKQRGAGSDM